MKAKRFERGQALVLIVLAIVAMFGFAALAVDIGRLYAERRRVQSAADAAALAAALASSRSEDYIQAALDQLALNDIVDTDPAANDDIRPDVQVYSPPLTGPYSDTTKYPSGDEVRYIQVIIRTSVNQIFSQFVYRGPLALTVEAVSHVQSSSGLFAGDVLHATSTNSCEAIRFDGTAKTTITGGDAYSDSGAGIYKNKDTGELACKPNDADKNCFSANQGGSGTVDIKDGTIITSGPWDTNGKAGTITTASEITQCAQPKVQPFINIPDCNLPNRSFSLSEVSKDNYHLQPGVYKDGIVVSGSKTNVVLDQGLYCLNGPLRISGGTMTGRGVMFYIQKGDVDLGGGALINLTMPGLDESVTPAVNRIAYDGANVPWTGMLLYMPYENKGSIRIGGASSSRYTGTIYAPGETQTAGQDKCVIEGTAGTISLSSNFICYTIKIAGGANINLNYQDKSSFHTPAIIDLMQ